MYRVVNKLSNVLLLFFFFPLSPYWMLYNEFICLCLHSRICKRSKEAPGAELCVYAWVWMRNCVLNFFFFLLFFFFFFLFPVVRILFLSLSFGVFVLFFCLVFFFFVLFLFFFFVFYNLIVQSSFLFYFTCFVYLFISFF